MRLCMRVSRCVPRMGCIHYLHTLFTPARRGPKDIGERQPLPSALWTPSPLRGQGCGPGPGAGGEMHFLARNEDAKRPRRRYRTRLWVRGLSGMWYFYRHVVRSATPGLRRRFARPRPSGFVGRKGLFTRAGASRLHFVSGGEMIGVFLRRFLFAQKDPGGGSLRDLSLVAHYSVGRSRPMYSQMPLIMPLTILA